MNVYWKEFKFLSSQKTYIKDITPEIKSIILKTKVKNGLLLVNSMHTTMGIVVQEIAEKNLLTDILEHTLKFVPEDKRSSYVSKDYKYPICEYRHRCQDNPYCDEIDEDYNAASHIRAIMFSHSSVALPIKDGQVELGKYQQIAVFEFDGRDGSGKNPVRQRRVQIWIYPFDAIKKID